MPKSKKHKVVEKLYKICKQKRNYKFHNDLVKELSKKVGFGNPFDYYFGTTKLSLKNIQIEIDLTIKFQRKIGVFEAKNGTSTSFSIYQIYHPFLYYYEANQHQKLNGKVKNIYGIYVVREKTTTGDLLKLWAYTFSKPYDITSLKLIKSSAYKLIQK